MTHNLLFQGEYKGWRDSVRHNLTQFSCFKQVLRDPTKPNGKGNFWTVAINEIPSEMYKRQNTSVAYQAPEGKTYVSDLRDVFDFQFGVSKVANITNEPSLASFFESTILQDVGSLANFREKTELSNSSISPPQPNPVGSYQTHATHQTFGNGALQTTHTNGLPMNFFSQSGAATYNTIEMYPPTHLMSQYSHLPLIPYQNSNFNDIKNHFAQSNLGVSQNPRVNSLPDSPTTSGSSNSSFNLDQSPELQNPSKCDTTDLESIKPDCQGRKSVIHRCLSNEPEVAAVMEYLPRATKPQLKRKRTGTEIEQAEEVTASDVSEVIEQAVDNAKSETVNIPASAPAEEPTILEKYGRAFAMDQFDFKP